jgi:replication factor C small subunit|tara:strand:+ start:1315 stop:2280 length:966 start_codon:yes stop_codon:yes gene_type:complete
MKRDFLWVEKYRPTKIDECILPEGSKKSFQGFLDQGEIPNLLLSGPAGVGKTTVARALCDQLGASYLLINGSDEGRSIDTIRNKVKQFATSISLTSGAAHKVVILDEADNMTYDVQMILRASIEEYHSNCRFIFTCNFINKLIDPIKSRCTVVDFTIKPSHKEKLQEQFFYRIRDILTKEEIKYEDKIIAKLIRRYYPDWRRLLNEAQRFASSGQIDAGILVDIADINIDDLIRAMKDRNYSTVKNWVTQNMDHDPYMVMRKIYDVLYKHASNASIPNCVLIIAKYQYQIQFVADQEINTLACLTEIMLDGVEWKSNASTK